ncbi:MAG: DNA gyrase inhibitor YacG [Planctomycetota bacterium]|jgi:endogenous inhibitor of DNA gyrase (YacG/DUF329 family)
MPPLRCPICDKPFEPEQSPAMPFCSHRCRWTDLKHWLDEQYGLVHEPEEEVEDGETEE